MTVQEAIEKRYSSRHLDDTKKISDKDIDLILSAGIKAPSGFGTEPWKFFVINGDLTKMQPVCWNQAHVGKSSHFIAFAQLNQSYVTENPEILTDKLKSNGFDDETVGRAMEYLKAGSGDQYYREQIMFACSQMVLQATELGIGSVIMGGFDPDGVAKLINLDTKKYKIALTLSLGYSTDVEPRKRKNRDFNEVVSKITI